MCDIFWPLQLFCTLMQFVLVIVTNLNLASVKLLCTLFNLLCTLYCICMLRYLACFFLVYPFGKGKKTLHKVNQKKFVLHLYFFITPSCFQLVFLSSRLWLRRLFLTGSETSAFQHNTSQLVDGSHHISEGWDFSLLQIGPQHKRNERWVIQQRRVFAGHLPSLLILPHWKKPNGEKNISSWTFH